MEKFDLDKFKELQQDLSNKAKMFANFPGEKNRSEMVEASDKLDLYVGQFKREVIKGFYVLRSSSVFKTKADALYEANAAIYKHKAVAVIPVEFWTGMGMSPEGDLP